MRPYGDHLVPKNLEPHERKARKRHEQRMLSAWDDYCQRKITGRELESIRWESIDAFCKETPQ